MEKKDFQTRAMQIISNMLDNPNDSMLGNINDIGTHSAIYPTTECFNAFDKLFDEMQQFPTTEQDTNNTPLYAEYIPRWEKELSDFVKEVGADRHSMSIKVDIVFGTTLPSMFTIEIFFKDGSGYSQNESSYRACFNKLTQYIYNSKGIKNKQTSALAVKEINDLIRLLPSDAESISDGYHTFSELYAHRTALFIALCKEISKNPAYQNINTSEVWRAKAHSDGSSYEGWFVLGIGLEAGKQISYHLPMSEWDKTEFAFTRERVPDFDGHTPNDVLNRLNNLELN